MKKLLEKINSNRKFFFIFFAGISKNNINSINSKNTKK